MSALAKKTILLVEDNADHVLLIRRAFHKAGVDCNLQVAVHGDEAVHYLEGTHGYDDRRRFPLPHLVLLDLKLPRRSGFDVLAWIRRSPEHEHLPVVVLTTSDQPDDILRARQLHANSYIVKPVDAEKARSMASSVGQFWLNHHRSQ